VDPRTIRSWVLQTIISISGCDDATVQFSFLSVTRPSYLDLNKKHASYSTSYCKTIRAQSRSCTRSPRHVRRHQLTPMSLFKIIADSSERSVFSCPPRAPITLNSISLVSFIRDRNESSTLYTYNFHPKFETVHAKDQGRRQPTAHWLTYPREACVGLTISVSR
jgi:hypothetical protein